MKKNIDPHKVSNFKNHQHSFFCMKTKPNNRYFNGEVKRLNQQRIDNFCTEELKQKDPALYYCRLGRKLPKKKKAFKEQQEKMMEQQRLEYNRRTAQKQHRLVHWCNAYDQGNYLNIHSEEYKRKTNKINKTRSYY